MTSCSLAKPGVQVAGFVTLSYENDTIKEAVSKDRNTKPRSREFPKMVFGDKPLTHLGLMILERIGTGYQIQNEDRELSTDRITSVFNVTSSHLVDVLLRDLLSSEQMRALLMPGAHVHTHGMLLARDTVGEELVLRTTFLRSALDATSATLLAVLNRCSRDNTTADFIGDFFSLPGIVKDIADYECLGDALLDKLQANGLSLRPVDFRQIEQTMTGFVGI